MVAEALLSAGGWGLSNRRVKLLPSPQDLVGKAILASPRQSSCAHHCEIQRVYGCSAEYDEVAPYKAPRLEEAPTQWASKALHWQEGSTIPSRPREIGKWSPPKKLWR